MTQRKLVLPKLILVVLTGVGIVASIPAAEKAVSPSTSSVEWPRKGDTVYADMTFLIRDEYSGRSSVLFPCAPLVVWKVKLVKQRPVQNPHTGKICRPEPVKTWYFKDAGGIVRKMDVGTRLRMYRTEEECKAPHEYPQPTLIAPCTSPDPE